VRRKFPLPKASTATERRIILRFQLRHSFSSHTPSLPHMLAMQSHHTTTEEHRSKKKYQPSITSYFEVRDDCEQHDDLRGLDPITRPRHQQRQHQVQRLAPQVPGQVQADLLNVGMRVRKSVPEGYKTHSRKMSALPSIQTTMSSRPTLEVKPPKEAVPDDFVHQRELLPFCGLHKVGGLGFAEQPTTNPHLYATGTRPPNAFPLQPEAFTQPFSSHNSFSSTSSSSSSSITRPHNPSKRSWQDEDEVRPLDGGFFFAIQGTRGMGMGDEVDEVPVSPLSETPPMGLNAMPPTRLYAKPKSRRGMGERTVSDEDIDMDLENATLIEGRVGAGCGSDFEEADFLTREVNMGYVRRSWSHGLHFLGFIRFLLLVHTSFCRHIFSFLLLTRAISHHERRILVFMKGI
jgi:hypothetical protein